MPPAQDLLFSICGLTIFSTIVCTLSAVMCCIQIFSLDVIHMVSTARSPLPCPHCTAEAWSRALHPPHTDIT